MWQLSNLMKYTYIDKFDLTDNNAKKYFKYVSGLFIFNTYVELTFLDNT